MYVFDDSRHTPIERCMTGRWTTTEGLSPVHRFFFTYSDYEPPSRSWVNQTQRPYPAFTHMRATRSVMKTGIENDS